MKASLSRIRGARERGTIRISTHEFAAPPQCDEKDNSRTALPAIIACNRLASAALLFAIDKTGHIGWAAWRLGCDPKILDLFACPQQGHKPARALSTLNIVNRHHLLLKLSGTS